ncbi:MAG: glycosyltransferase family 8 protein [Bacillales bacterium]|nr:glycosyltransferase family 8 protein [Bacillales bacterium]
MNLLFTSNKNYLFHIIEVLSSIRTHNNCHLDVYIISNDIKTDDFNVYKNILSDMSFVTMSIDESLFKKGRTSSRYPLDIYYRLFASFFLPEDMDRILYLDPDIAVIGDLNELYNMPFNDKMFIGASHLSSFLLWFNQLKNGTKKDHLYINTGVILMNLELMRKSVKIEDISDIIKKKRWVMTLPDQDVLNILYGDKISLVSKFKYNLADRDIRKYNLFHKNKIDLEWIKKNTVIIHYYGRNKPWKKSYKGILNAFYVNMKEKDC